jgi:hypothetical protein
MASSINGQGNVDAVTNVLLRAVASHHKEQRDKQFGASHGSDLTQQSALSELNDLPASTAHQQQSPYHNVSFSDFPQTSLFYRMSSMGSVGGFDDDLFESSVAIHKQYTDDDDDYTPHVDR